MLLGNYNMNLNNNTDVKKYVIGQKDFFKKLNDFDSSELTDFFVQKSSGNLNKAKKIGSLLAEYLVLLSSQQVKSKNSKDLINFKLFEDNKKILLWCAANTVLETLIDNEYAVSAAKTSLVQTMKIKNKDFYNNINNSLATSFFVLCKRSGNKIGCYGNYFAYLCQQEKNIKISKIGSILYLIYINLIKRKFKYISNKIKLEDI